MGSATANDQGGLYRRKNAPFFLASEDPEDKNTIIFFQPVSYLEKKNHLAPHPRKFLKTKGHPVLPIIGSSRRHKTTPSVISKISKDPTAHHSARGKLP